ncbi:MAG: exodeoxyribonuclease V subunit alpha [Deltaproteobacteria bacterium]|nr:exodeoxyribonuclease V subunit alpha [Deltaproteobacteria bacterium]
MSASRRPVRLWPWGTVAAAFSEARGRSIASSARDPRLPKSLAEAVASFDIDEGLLYEVWELLRCAPGLEPQSQAALAYLAAACLLSARRGSTRLPLEASQIDPILSQLGAHRGDRAHLRALLNAKPGERGGAETLLGSGDEYKPFIVDDGCLYLHRMRSFETRLADALRARMDTPPDPPPGLAAAFDEVLARPARSDAGPMRLSGEQERAVLAALHLPLAVITGGPGTGKTSIVVTLLRVLARMGVALESIALAAPTGKAADRMERSIERALKSIEPLEGADRALLERCPKPLTLHRLLGYSPSGDRFRHHENNPLAERVVIVDECSMIDLFLMDRLLRSVDSRGRLVLLGDADQLPSVEAGAVFRDLVPERGGVGAKSWDGLVRAPLPPSGPAVESTADLREGVAVRLTRSYRQDDRDPEGRQILDAAALVVAGSTGELLTRVTRRESAGEVEFRGVELVPATSPAQRDAMIERWFQARVRPAPELSELCARTYRFDDEGKVPEEAREALEKLARHFERSRVLCVTRGEGRVTGTAAINGSLRGLWLEMLGIPEGRKAPPFTLGEPVMVERNDYGRGLYNGDQGLMLKVQEHEGRASARAVFARRGGWAAYAPDSAEGLSVCFAMTVHKAQGSEYDSVLLVLPDEDIPLLTREILYTAITRARRSVVILGDPEVLEAGVGRPLVRWSGVGARLAKVQKRRRAG